MNSELTKEAFDVLTTGMTSEPTYKQTNLAQFTYYRVHGVLLTEIYNYVSAVSQYYVQDINA